MENFTTDFFKEEELEENSGSESLLELPDDLILKSSSKEFKPSGLFTQIEDEIKMSHLRKKYRKFSP